MMKRMRHLGNIKVLVDLKQNIRVEKLSKRKRMMRKTNLNINLLFVTLSENNYFMANQHE